MIAWRIADGGFTLFDGGGAARYGGRWNSVGRAVIYGGTSYAICALEILMRSGRRHPPRHHVFVWIDVPEDVDVETLDEAKLPGWNDAAMDASRRFGDRWFDERRSAVLLVPSAVTRIDRNVVINPLHPDFPRLATSAPRPVVWDERLFGGERR